MEGEDDFTTRAFKRMSNAESTTEAYKHGKDQNYKEDPKFGKPRKKDQAQPSGSP